MLDPPPPPRPRLPVATYTEAIRTDAELLVGAIARAGADAEITTCPGWDVHELVQHLGRVHRWATAIVVERRSGPGGGSRSIEVPEGRWNTDELGRWVLDGAGDLAVALDTADPDVDCWTFLPSESPRDFWARRQAHETAIHRVDAELAAGASASPFDVAFAADGADERLGFIVRDAIQRSDRSRTLRVTALDAPGDWDLVVGTDGVAVRPGGSGPTDATAVGGASDVYLALWRRPAAVALDTSGDPGLLAMFFDDIHDGE